MTTADPVGGSTPPIWTGRSRASVAAAHSPGEPPRPGSISRTRAGLPAARSSLVAAPLFIVDVGESLIRGVGSCLGVASLGDELGVRQPAEMSFAASPLALAQRSGGR